MHVSLTPELEARIKAKVESGLYNNASEVIREALRFMDAHEEWVLEIKKALLRKQLKNGVNQIDTGAGIVVESKDALDAIFDDLRPQPKE
ncbi:MAG: type II toxin-antitoxin system ParD family antitoxin [Aequoribacter sp.]|jgi:antitoxin ParD1/3/4|uniref:type II toxin-antitoxin system ParD family antitoxin n=1 Tax=Aequoribacter sp. TaxID=2847771 RepID=UPI003C3DE849